MPTYLVSDMRRLSDVIRGFIERNGRAPEATVHELLTAVEEFLRSYDDDNHQITKYETLVCGDCGAEGETGGHQTCQYPKDHE